MTPTPTPPGETTSSPAVVTLHAPCGRKITCNVDVDTAAKLLAAAIRSNRVVSAEQVEGGASFRIDMTAKGGGS